MVYQTQSTHAQPSKAQFRGNYIVQYSDDSGVHQIPFVQSWYARAETLKHLKAGDDVSILAWNKKINDYEYSEKEMDKTRAAMPQERAVTRVNGEVYEKLSGILTKAHQLTQQARKGRIDPEDYETFRELVGGLDNLLGWTGTEEEDIP